MKKPIKYALYVISGIVATLALTLLLANYVFTTKLSLSCNGEEKTTITVGSRITPVDIKSKLEGITIKIIKYPFRNHQLTIASDSVYVISDDEKAITSVLDTLIMGARTTKNKDVEIHRSLSFNRLTRIVEITTLFRDFNNGSELGTKFVGLCTEVKAL